MAKNTAVHVVDDLTGEPAAETVAFGLDGLDHEIDLSTRNAAALREIFAPYVRHGRRTGGRKQRPQLVPAAVKTPEPQDIPVKPKRTAAAAKTATRPAKPAPAKAEPAKPAAPVKPAAKTRTAVKTTEKTAAVKNPVTEPKPVKTTQPARRAAKKIPAVTFSSSE
ncbi:Lsr2 family protein [Amycolatopsis rhabdoformis]|uniref:Lsr2 family protein n=1 Tax=Amycolatopsis rhabdoformis TaxID=1448059 RepID=A0ABZ1I7W5_9PSEU|nr:Lsr2 family protein [Amycolatopsis rhabdoformis]WSE30495.1 Lsr2 family protein [Amycolatopsis rhabdoformis]